MNRTPHGPAPTGKPVRFQRAGAGRLREDVDAVADLALALASPPPGTAVDAREATRPAASGPDPHTDDGAHPSPAGRRAVSGGPAGRLRSGGPRPRGVTRPPSPPHHGGHSNVRVPARPCARCGTMGR
ncbi:hypothetical protein GCM10017667_24230 [Streptomyces filamentosus]|uniref:Uncharacterized protein n=1 Tax=Streptomyces filamentosus TaxID=67294 RepID=A0A919BIN3_STRFL|nr:hypothetical protein GCM10017667_24230 [Streptomyces filamentosus]